MYMQFYNILSSWFSFSHSVDSMILINVAVAFYLYIYIYVCVYVYSRQSVGNILSDIKTSHVVRQSAGKYYIKIY